MGLLPMFDVKIYNSKGSFIQMTIKVEDIMLDLATGDASHYDAYIQEAMGQVNVSAAIYEAAYEIAESNGEMDTVVQEACVEAGLPTNKEDAIELVYESCSRELIGTQRHLYTEMAKFDERASKPTTPYGAMNAVAKELGCGMKLDGSLEYCMEYAMTTVPKGSLTLKSGTKFIKGSAMEKMTRNAIQAVCLICNALCIDTASFTDLKEIKAIVQAPVSTKCGKSEDGKDACSLGYMTSALKSAKKYISKTNFSESDYTTKLGKEDVSKVQACDFAMTKLAKFVKGKLFDVNGEYTEEKIKAAVGKCSRKKVSDSAKELNEKCCGNDKMIVSLNKDLHEMCKNIIKGFNDCADALITTKLDEE